ncbi:uncharacterized protein LOC134278125 [Saccostrea cucullata]|uniref:uncharacterized protein LOC134278125 n=1 Tax=Saccostrea cuccullata TaxID=36930 RepID=UPI002ED10574
MEAYTRTSLPAYNLNVSSPEGDDNNRGSDAVILSLSDVAALVQTLEVILPRFQDNPLNVSPELVQKDFEYYISKGISEVGTVNIIPPVTTCCGQLKKVGQKVCNVFRSRFKPAVAVMYELKCSKCNTVYKCSTYKKKSIELYYSDVLEQEYFASTCDSVFSMELLRKVDIDLYRKSASFEGIAYAYNDEHLGDKGKLWDATKYRVYFIRQTGRRA